LSAKEEIRDKPAGHKANGKGKEVINHFSPFQPITNATPSQKQ
jgi:hypothetical protein